MYVIMSAEHDSTRVFSRFFRSQLVWVGIVSQLPNCRYPKRRYPTAATPPPLPHRRYPTAATPTPLPHCRYPPPGGM